MITTSMVSGSGLADPPARGMTAAAFQAIANDARKVLAAKCSRREMRRVLKEIADLAAAELEVDGELEECWRMADGG